MNNDATRFIRITFVLKVDRGKGKVIKTLGIKTSN